MKIQFEDFISTVEEGERQGKRSPSFWNARDSLGNYLASPIILEEVKGIIYTFLADWKSYRKEIGWDQLAKIWTGEYQNISLSLGGTRIEDAQDEEIAQAVKLYDRLREIEGIGHTNASKLLSLSLIELGVMWDGDIRKKYKELHPQRPIVEGPRLKRNLYREFLRSQRAEVNNLIQQCMKNKKLPRTEAIQWLREIPLRASESVSKREKPLAKLIDQYNYWKTR